MLRVHAPSTARIASCWRSPSAISRSRAAASRFFDSVSSGTQAQRDRCEWRAGVKFVDICAVSNGRRGRWRVPRWTWTDPRQQNPHAAKSRCMSQVRCGPDPQQRRCRCWSLLLRSLPYRRNDQVGEASATHLLDIDRPLINEPIGSDDVAQVRLAEGVEFLQE
jgi:hypothetical protein